MVSLRVLRYHGGVPARARARGGQCRRCTAPDSSEAETATTAGRDARPARQAAMRASGPGGGPLLRSADDLSESSAAQLLVQCVRNASAGQCMRFLASSRAPRCCRSPLSAQGTQAARALSTWASQARLRGWKSTPGTTPSVRAHMWPRPQRVPYACFPAPRADDAALRRASAGRGVNVFAEADFSVLMYAALSLSFEHTQERAEFLTACLLAWLVQLRDITRIAHVSFVAELLRPPHKDEAYGRAPLTEAAAWRKLATHLNLRLDFLLAVLEAVKDAAAEQGIAVVHSLALVETDAHACGRSLDVDGACVRFGKPIGFFQKGVACGRDGDWMLLLHGGLYLQMDGIYNAPGNNIIDIDRTLAGLGVEHKWMAPMAVFRDNDAWLRSGEPVRGASWNVLVAAVVPLVASAAGKAAATDEQRLDLLVEALCGANEAIAKQFADDATLLPAMKRAMRYITKVQVWGDEATGDLRLPLERPVYRADGKVFASVLHDIVDCSFIDYTKYDKELIKHVTKGTARLVAVGHGMAWSTADGSKRTTYDIDAMAKFAMFELKDRFGWAESDDEGDENEQPSERTSRKETLAVGGQFRSVLDELRFLSSPSSVFRHIKADGCTAVLHAYRKPGGGMEAARQLLESLMPGCMDVDDEYDVTYAELMAEGSLFRSVAATLGFKSFRMLYSRLGLNNSCALVRAFDEPGGGLETARLMLNDALGPPMVVDEFDVSMETHLAEGSRFRLMVAALDFPMSAWGLLARLKLERSCALVRAFHEPCGGPDAARRLLLDWLGLDSLDIPDEFDVSEAALLGGYSVFRNLHKELKLKDKPADLFRRLGRDRSCALVRAACKEPDGSLDAARQQLIEWLGPDYVKEGDEFDVTEKVLRKEGSQYLLLMKELGFPRGGLALTARIGHSACCAVVRAARKVPGGSLAAARQLLESLAPGCFEVKVKAPMDMDVLDKDPRFKALAAELGTSRNELKKLLKLAGCCALMSARYDEPDGGLDKARRLLAGKLAERAAAAVPATVTGASEVLPKRPRCRLLNAR